MFSGCASVQLSKNILDFKITPETGIKAGTIVTVTVKTSDDVKQVYGSIDMLGAPQVPLKYDDKNNVWYIRQMIPIGIIITPGEYLAKIDAVTKSDGHFYADKKITIK